jgi:triosephosphate isomerase
LFCRDGVDGALVGGASLHPDQFLAVVQAAISASRTQENSAETAA